jgi:hypothetical protein
VVFNLVSAFSPECMTDSLIKQSYMSTQRHHFGWLDFMCSNLSESCYVWVGTFVVV